MIATDDKKKKKKIRKKIVAYKIVCHIPKGLPNKHLLVICKNKKKEAEEEAIRRTVKFFGVHRSSIEIASVKRIKI